MKVAGFTKAGVKSTQVSLPTDIFAIKFSEDLLAQAVERSLANVRQASAKTLTRGEVRGGGRKPWKQKGTGRARFGSSRVNIWRSGGVAHGPNGQQNYYKDMPKNMIRASIKAALSAQAEKITIIDQLALSEPKTQKASALIQKLGLEGNILMVVAKVDQKFALATRNLVGIKLITAHSLSAYDILLADAILVEQPALEVITSWLGAKK